MTDSVCHTQNMACARKKANAAAMKRRYGSRRVRLARQVTASCATNVPIAAISSPPPAATPGTAQPAPAAAMATVRRTSPETMVANTKGTSRRAASRRCHIAGNIW